MWIDKQAKYAKLTVKFQSLKEDRVLSTARKTVLAKSLPNHTIQVLWPEETYTVLILNKSLSQSHRLVN